jgi:hypothetical protein
MMKPPVLCYCWTHNWQLAKTPADEPAYVKLYKNQLHNPRAVINSCLQVVKQLCHSLNCMWQLPWEVWLPLISHLLFIWFNRHKKLLWWSICPLVLPCITFISHLYLHQKKLVALWTYNLHWDLTIKLWTKKILLSHF